MVRKVSNEAIGMRGRRLLLLPDQGAHELLELLDMITDADFALALP